MTEKDKDHDSLLDSLVKLTGEVAGGTLDLARNAATMSAMFGETWVRNSLMNRLEPERLEAMAEAGHFLRDAREMAGISIKEMAETLDLTDRSVLEDIESGQTIMPLELMLRSASLLARHDPIPFLIKFMRTYNPALERTLEQLGVMALPKQYERERRFVNLVRQHDSLRALTDDEYERFIHYMEGSCNLVLDVMIKEKEANAPGGKAESGLARPKAKAKARRKAKPKAKVKAKTKARTAAPAKKATPRPRKRAPADRRKVP